MKSALEKGIELGDLIRPLCVDLDHTIIKTDLTIEGLWEFLKKDPRNIWQFLVWLRSSRSLLKEKLTINVDLDLYHLPVNPEVLEFVRCEFERGRKVILITGSHQKWADGLLKKYSFFSEAYGTENGRNLIGAHKLDFIKNDLNIDSFDYIGDSKADLHLWKDSHTSHFVGHKKELLAKIPNLGNSFPNEKNGLRQMLAQMRFGQWVKNFLIFIPILIAHQYSNLEVLGRGLLALFSFGLMASSLYTLNDLYDLESDRKHRSKKLRPIASGSLSIPLAISMVLILFFLSLAVALLVNFKLTGVLLFYAVANIAYSFFLKRVLAIDLFLLSFFYLSRIVAGAVATEIELTAWIMLFGFFLFIGLAMLKAFMELNESYLEMGKFEVLGRPYTYNDVPILRSFGVSSCLISVLVMGLYIYQQKLFPVYREPGLLWGIAILLFYWTMSFWIRANRGRIKGDPFIFAIKDRVSQVVALLCVILIFAAKYLPFWPGLE